MTCQIETMDPPRIFTIEWDMMDKSRFFSLSMVNSFALRGLLYPFTVIKTRLQIQRQNALYTGTFDAFLKILKYEGACGLYRGFWINSIQMVSGIGYIITYEKVRHMLTLYADIRDGRLKGLIGGGCGSLVGQTIITPFDVVSQHMMVLGQLRDKSVANPTAMNPLNIQLGSSRRGLAMAIVREVYKKDGLKGFYRGYYASLCTYVPSSALWWMFYPVYSDALASVLPLWTSHMFIHCIGGQMSGITVAVITNPLDVIRARIQVHRMNSFSSALNKIWFEEGILFLSKGLSARIIQTFFSSFFVVLGYETLKRWSVYDQYKDQIRW
ncbi:solute carrier family 25 member 44-like [Uloborus diversus]|uniref:solute carrier family 25 member 44-like n=1 Tax=Uloborus diversus TaxID=327109 RepID=UPI00240A5B30|nr:solute carrier family 25 member 44-like [Uloborus diversus]XP_054722775.1 solute carrier family 25 member 44-like [Uloborus diversus]